MSVDDRIRAATQASAATVRDVPPFELPLDPAPGRPRRTRSRAWWAGLLIPVAAAVAVVVVAAVLVAVRDAPGQPRPTMTTVPAAPASPVLGYAGAGPAIPAGQVPRFGVFINEGANKQLSDLSVVDRDGETIARFNPPAHQGFDGVAGARDGETFVVDVAPRGGGSTLAGANSFYLLRITPAVKSAVSLVRLPIQGVIPFASLLGLALSPDGRTLAVLFAPDQAPGQQDGATLLRTYSVVTGQLLRTWAGPAPKSVIGNPGEANQDGLSWLANGRDLAFTQGGTTVRELDTTRPGTSLLAGSRPVFAMPQTGTYCKQALVTPDGKTVLCATAPQNDDVCDPGPGLEFDAYSAATGKLEKVLYHFGGKCNAFSTAQLIWAGSATTAVVLVQASYLGGSGETDTKMVAMLVQGKLLQLRFPAVPLGSPPGTIAY